MPPSAPQRKLTAEDAAFSRLSAFAAVMSPETPPAAHHRLLCRKLEAVERGEIKRLMVFMPPGSAKSHYANVMFSAWFMGRNPEKMLLTCSATTDLAERWGRRVRNLIDTPEARGIFGVALSNDNKAAASWGTARGGEYKAAGVGANIVGRRADLAVLDDPVADRKTAESRVEREKIWSWYKTDFWTRLKPGAAVVLIMTRWHEDDLAGRLLKEARQGGEQWEVLSIPAVAENDNDPLGRKAGEPLWPEWFTPEMFKQAKRDKRTWSALYQQRPTVEGGGILRRENVQLWPARKALPRFIYVVQSYDTAYTEKTQNDPTAFGAFGVFMGPNPWDPDGREVPHVMLCDCWVDHLEVPDLLPTVLKEFRSEYGASAVEAEFGAPLIGPARRKQLNGRKPDVVLVEDKGSGIGLRQALARQNIPVKAYNPGRLDKVARAHLITPFLDAGLFWVPESSINKGKPRDWVEPLLEQMEAFPNAEHDDMVDMLTQAIRLLIDQRFLVLEDDADATPEEPDEERPSTNPYAA